MMTRQLLDSGPEEAYWTTEEVLCYSMQYSMASLQLLALLSEHGIDRNIRYSSESTASHVAAAKLPATVLCYWQRFGRWSDVYRVCITL